MRVNEPDNTYILVFLNSTTKVVKTYQGSNKLIAHKYIIMVKKALVSGYWIQQSEAEW